MNRKKLFRIVEVYLNDYRIQAVEAFYGIGSQLKINSINYSTKEKIMLVEVIVKLGDLINEEVLNPDMARVLVEDAMVYIYPEHKINVMVRWDS